MSEQEPAMVFKIDGKEVEAHRRNTKLYTFIGEASMYDHTFVTLEHLPEENRAKGTYFFKTLLPEAYAFMYKFMSEHGFPANLNYETPADCDIEAFNQFAYGDIEASESFPEEWEKEIGDKHE
jgi:hypothetical protein